MRSLELETRSSISRLARSTCCQRPNCSPPERRLSVEPAHSNGSNSRVLENLSNLPRMAAPCQCSIPLLLTSVVQQQENARNACAPAGLQAAERAIRTPSRSTPLFCSVPKPREFLRQTKRTFVEVFAMNAQPFEDLRPRISGSGVEPISAQAS